MNAPNEKFLTVNLGEAEVRVPREAAVVAYLAQLVKQQDEIKLPLRRTDRLIDYAMTIGTTSEHGEIYAGLTLLEGKPHELWLLPDKAEELDWDAAIAWAKYLGVGASLPTRFDALVLWQNLRSEFEKDAYWTCEEYAGAAGYAWYQHFYYGSQSNWHKSSKNRARAVRRSPI